VCTSPLSASVNGTRIIRLRTEDDTLGIDCSSILPDRETLNERFGNAFVPVWNVIGKQLVSDPIERLAEGESY
jgi:hypothetical protein